MCMCDVHAYYSDDEICVTRTPHVQSEVYFGRYSLNTRSSVGRDKSTRAELDTDHLLNAVCFPPAGLSFGFASAGDVSFSELAKASGEFAFGTKGEC